MNAETTLMKGPFLITSFAVLAIAQTPIRHSDVNMTANRIDHIGAVTHLAGHVMIETDGMTLRADEADFNSDTTEIVARGEVHVKLK
jgi:lipopolysaccharide assembly outer membrane protein LptD (OstA)